MKKYIEKYWHHPKFYAIHLYLCFIFAFLGILVFGFSYFYASFGEIKETGFYLLCLYSFSFCACSGFFIVAASQQNEKDIKERKDVLKGCWMWLSGFLPIVVGMTLWILYESSTYALDYKVQIKPSPELTRELEILTGKEFKNGFFDYSLDHQIVDIDALLNDTARSIFIGTTHPRYKTDQRDIRSYKYEAIVKENGTNKKVQLTPDIDTAELFGVPANSHDNNSSRSRCFLMANFNPNIKSVIEVLGNNENKKFYRDDEHPSPTYFIKENKLFIDTRDNGSAWSNFCAEHFNQPHPIPIKTLPTLSDSMLRKMGNADIYLLGTLFPHFHKDIHPIKKFSLRFSLKRFARRV